MESDNIVVSKAEKYSVTLLGLLLFTHSFEEFPELLPRRVRVITHETGEKTNKQIRRDEFFAQGYARCFTGLIEYIENQLPRNEQVKTLLRENVPLYPTVVLREIIANAMIHQDFSVAGIQLTISIYRDRLEVKNAGVPVIDVHQFINQESARNHILSNAMRKMGICEASGNGFDRSIQELELHQMPAPSVQVTKDYTTVILKNFSNYKLLKHDDKVWATYCHCVIKYLSDGDENMSNSSLRQRFGLSESETSSISQLIKATVEKGHIKVASGSSRKYSRYVPYWA